MKPIHYLCSVIVCCLLCVLLGGMAVAAKPGLLFDTVKSWQLPFKPLDMVHSLDGKLVFVLTEQSTVLVYKTNGTLTGTIPVEKGVTAIDTDAKGELLYLTNSTNNTFTTVSVDFIVNIDTSSAPFRGKADAPITVAVFSDFE